MSRKRVPRRVEHVGEQGQVEAESTERIKVGAVPVGALDEEAERLVDVVDRAGHLVGALVRDQPGNLLLWGQDEKPRALVDVTLEDGPQFVEFYRPRGTALELLCSQCRAVFTVRLDQLLGAPAKTRRAKVPRIRLD